MEATSAPPILLPGIDHLPCLQEIRSVKDKPFYCQSSVGTIPFQGRVFLLLASCKQTRLSATTVEPYGNGLSVYKLSQMAFILSLIHI